MKNVTYIGICVDLPSNVINPIVDNARDISGKTLSKYIDTAELTEFVRNLGYRSFNHFKEDCCVRFGKSWVGKKLFVFISWSSIKYIWKVEKGHEKNL